MDRVERYRQAILRVIGEYAQHPVSHGEVETEIVTDSQHDHYEVIHVGWQGERRVHGCVLHIDIRDGKVWIQHNGTDQLITDELMAAGVQREDIVLGFHPPSARKYTEFAVG